MNHRAIPNNVIFASPVLAGLHVILLNILGIQNVLVLAPVHSCGKRFKL
jgi:hypothetical protein